MAVVAYQDVEISLGRLLSGEMEIAQVIQWIEGAELQIRLRLGELSLLDQDALAFVVREAVAARARNPEAYQYEAIDDYRYGMPKESRTIAILDEWWEMLAPTSRAAAYTVRPTFEPDTGETETAGWA